MMKKVFVALSAAALVFGMASCKGRTQENMESNGDTVELPGMDSGAVEDGGEVVMNPSASDTQVIADSPAEANAQAAADSAK